MTFATKLAALGALATTALAHGTVWGFTADGIYHENFHPNPEAPRVPEAAGWYAENVDRGFVTIADYGHPDIICHKAARPSKYSATVAAGGSVSFHWTPWPLNHPGPVLTFAANCHGECGDVDMLALEWVKIDEGGLDEANDEWAAIKLANDNSTWTTTIPETLAPGNYVLRHEIISVYGRQHYPSCINFEITGNGTEEPEGVLGVDLYEEVAAHEALTAKRCPGPELYKPGSSPAASSAASDAESVASSTLASESTAPTIIDDNKADAAVPSPTSAESSGAASSSTAVESTAEPTAESLADESTTPTPSTTQEPVQHEPTPTPTDDLVTKPGSCSHKKALRAAKKARRAAARKARRAARAAKM